jgi:uncharacterized integral membrane protein (TIGR00698 family)
VQLPALQTALQTSPRSFLGGLRGLLPGIVLAALLAMLSLLLADSLSTMASEFGPLPVSPIVVAIVLGIAIRNGMGLDAAFQPGLIFSQCRILQLGIVLLGIRLSLGEFAIIGLSSIPLIIVCIGSALLMIGFLARRLGISPQLGTLIAAGTSICGATAIVTTAPIVGARSHEVSYAIACITLFGIAATLAYPTLAYWVFDGDAHRVGMFLGTAVHDTAQVVGAGMIYENIYGTEQALDTATITKLVRNLSMLIVIPLLSIRFQRAHHAGGTRPHWTKLVPLFIVGFALMSLLRTVGDLGATPFGILAADQWATAVSTMKSGAEFSLLIAMAAVGLNTKLAGLTSIGLRPLGLGMIAAATVGLLSGTLITLFY